MSRSTRTGGREATKGVIPGRIALSVGRPELPEPAGFSWRSLSEIACLESGHTPSRSRDDYWGGEVPWIGIRDATANHGKVIDNTLDLVTQNGLDNSSARLLPAGTVCLSRTASVGYVVEMGRPMATSQDFVNWVCGPQLNSSYLRYIFMLEQASIRRFAHGTTHQTMYYPEAKALNVLIPTRRQQDATADVLGAIDDKIESNETIARLLRELAGATYARAIAGSTATRAIGEVSQVFDGPHATPRKTDAGPWFLSISSLQGGRLALEESAHLSDQDFDRWTRRVTPHVGDLLFSYETRLGEAALMPSGIRGCLGRRMALLRPLDGAVGSHVLAQAFASRSFQETIRMRTVHGATVDRIALSDMRSWPIEIPLDADGKLERMLASMGECADQADRESASLVQIRNELLPLLMSGIVRVRDAKRPVHEDGGDDARDDAEGVLGQATIEVIDIEEN